MKVRSIYLFEIKRGNQYLTAVSSNVVLELGDILVFVDSKKKDIEKRLIKRKNFNKELLSKFKKIQLNSNYKKKKSDFIIKNNFTKKHIDESIRNILNEIL